MRHYEMIFIVHPNVPEEEVSTITDKVTSLINQHKGEVVRLEKWGKKKFAYKIKKCTKGYYFLLNFLGLPEILAELERTLRYDENILRFQTVTLDMEEVEAVRRRVEQDSGGEEHSVSPGEETFAEGER